MPRKEREKGKTREKSEEKEERDRDTEGGTSNPIPATDALIGDEEQNGKQKKERGNGSRTRLSWIFQSPPTTRRDHMGSLLTLSPQGYYFLLLFFFLFLKLI